VKFFIGLHAVSHARHFARCMISVNRLRDRKSDFAVGEWIMDSGAFTEVTKHGGYREAPAVYAEQVERWSRCGRMLAAVSQDYMCEPIALQRTGLSLAEHQALTIARYRELTRLVSSVPVLPVLQGYAPSDYVRHIDEYGSLLPFGAWVGVGSVCKRNGDIGAIEEVLLAIHARRPDLRLHGFGLKFTALSSDIVRTLLYSADSMAWSFAARYEGRDANSRHEAQRYIDRVESHPVQHHLFTPRAEVA
jgi:hypothetical protein